MAYTKTDAKRTLYGYMGLEPEKIVYVENTDQRGFILDHAGEKCVIFIYPISHKADDTKNFFDTRDSGALERGTAWNYAIQNNLKYFCFAVHDQVPRYNNYIFSLECNEKVIAEVAGTVNGIRAGSGTQVVIPNNYTPDKLFERIQTKNGFYISAIHRDVIYDYIEKYDNRPYLVDKTKIDLSDLSDEICKLKYDTGICQGVPRNRIVFGAPGTGKSYAINQQRIELIGADNETDYERVTFHPDYSYANFVGTYKPVMVEGQDNALTDSDTKYVLSVLNNKSRTAQEKYDLLYDRFRDEGLTRLPLLLGLYTDEPFRTRKQDGSDAVGDNTVERNHGRAIRKYIGLITDKERANDIAYEYVPGPFMRVYVNAMKSARTDNPKPYLLIIEEINRANVAAVFGDVFQLLDRGDGGVSEYPIQASEDIKKYLAKELDLKLEECSKIRIPDNMFIWATMNSADQGVFPMDTAFKRRWDFTYLGIDDSDEKIRGKYVYLAEDKSQKVEWNKLRKAINHFLAKEKINEDKQLGPYFIARSIVVPVDGDEIDRDQFIRVFKNKVLMYLFEDAAKQKRSKLFEGCFQNSIRYSEICREFEAKGIGIFNHDIQLETEPEEPQRTPTEDEN